MSSQPVSDALDEGRTHFQRRAWAQAYARLSEADAHSPVPVEDLRRLAVAAYLIGRDDDSASWWERAYHELRGAGEGVPAARCAGWLALGLLLRGEVVLGGGWLARLDRLLAEVGEDCAERAFLLLPTAIQRIDAGDSAGGYAAASAAVELAERFADPDLAALARQIQGRALIRLERAAEGMALLDELMIEIAADEVSPVVAGLVYCSVIEGCQETFDLRRAQEWTAALSRWCSAQPELVPYRGQCLVHRSQILLLHGAWPDAREEARRASEGFGPADAAWYQLAELHRLTGEFARAEEAYLHTSRLGRQPQPGLALLRLAQGQLDAAAAAIRRALAESAETGDRSTRCALLPAYVEIVLTAGDPHAARTAADELAGFAAGLDSPMLRASAAHATGAVRLAEGDPAGALGSLRDAWNRWRELDAPYEAARTRVLIALACRAMGDEDGAQLEFDAAGWVFQQLGAGPDLDRTQLLGRPSSVDGAGALTARELQVLRLIAAGKTNRAIATELFLSEKTVARHVSNIFAKLGVASRSAATAYAYEHGLVP